MQIERDRLKLKHYNAISYQKIGLKKLKKVKDVLTSVIMDEQCNKGRPREQVIERNTGFINQKLEMLRKKESKRGVNGLDRQSIEFLRDSLEQI